MEMIDIQFELLSYICDMLPRIKDRIMFMLTCKHIYNIIRKYNSIIIAIQGIKPYAFPDVLELYDDKFGIYEVGFAAYSGIYKKFSSGEIDDENMQEAGKYYSILDKKYKFWMLAYDGDEYQCIEEMQNLGPTKVFLFGRSMGLDDITILKCCPSFMHIEDPPEFLTKLIKEHRKELDWYFS